MTDEDGDGDGDDHAPVFVDGQAETCPDCGGDLRYQTQVSILCADCGRDFEHWKTSAHHRLFTADPAFDAEPELVATAPRGDTDA